MNQQPAYDKLLNTEVMFQLGDTMQKAKVVQRSLDPNGTIVGSYDDNPILNFKLYDVDSGDGTMREYAANIIAEHMLTCT